jgi:hypothetical protein
MMEVFTLKYLQFIFSNIFTFAGFIIILLIITNGIGKLVEPIRNFIASVKNKYKSIQFRDSIADRVKPPKDLK